MVVPFRCKTMPSCIVPQLALHAEKGVEEGCFLQKGVLQGRCQIRWHSKKKCVSYNMFAGLFLDEAC